MAEMVGSAVVQEAVGRAVSSVLGNLEEKASKQRSIQRLDMAHAELEFALERSSKLPITDVSLLRQRRMVKRAYKECGDVLQRCKLRVVEDDEDQSFSSLPRRIFHAARSIVYSPFSSKRDDPSREDVEWFEWFAGKASRFVSDVQAGCSLSLYRFLISCPLTRQILEMKPVWYEKVEESRTNRVMIMPCWSVDHGALASILFTSEYDRSPNKNFYMLMALRVSESSDVVGTITKCLRSLAPVFKPFAELTIGVLAQLSQLQEVPRNAVVCSLVTNIVTYLLPDSSFCTSDGHGPRANTSSSRFPLEVMFMVFWCDISAFEYSRQLQGSIDEADRDVLRDWPPLELRVIYSPHAATHGVRGCQAEEIIGLRSELVNLSLPEMEEMVVTKAIDHFICEPELTMTLYRMTWRSVHGEAIFFLEKQSTRGA